MSSDLDPPLAAEIVGAGSAVVATPSVGTLSVGAVDGSVTADEPAIWGGRVAAGRGKSTGVASTTPPVNNRAKKKRLSIMA